ncbi:prolyl oligopeptidase family serine peptidase [Acidobacteriota bacterium]
MKNFVLTKILAAILLLSCIILGQDDYNSIKLHDTSKATGAEVTFLENPPIIDGVLDRNLESLPVRSFALALKQKNDKLVNTHFRLAYGVSFFYLYIEAEAEHLTYRERAYQFGDGFMLIIARPKPANELADEYYEVACGAKNNPEFEFPKLFLSAVNLNRIFLEISSDTKLEFSEGHGKISFELYIPWKDIKPSNPFINDSIGFNLLFTKATSGPEGRIRYLVVDEERIPFTRRNYSLLKFQKPEVKDKPQVYLNFQEGHITSGDPLHLTLTALSPVSLTDTIKIEFYKDDKKQDNTILKQVKYDKGKTLKKITIPTYLKPGKEYSLKWNSYTNPSSSGNQSFIIMPEFDAKDLHEKLIKTKRILSKHSVATLQFQTDEMREALKALKEYEDGKSEYSKLNSLLESFVLLDEGQDPLKDKTGFIRKAYRSNLDNTLQPYMIYLPADYDKNKKYPLFVFLHGSDMTEISIRGAKGLIPDGFIGLGPLGRGTSNAYTIDHAQEDISEAIDAIKEQYSIDDENIVLAGFSMGGYGVYRTYWETPGKYKALVVFSGGPNVGVMFSRGQPAPNFLDEKYLAVFKNVPIFIHHGQKDLNAPFELTQELVEKLNKEGAKVKFIADPERGHEAPSKENLKIFFNWMKDIIK